MPPRNAPVPAARSMLLTVLGEYVAPRNRTVFRDGLVGALETLGYGTHAARQAIARSAASGWLDSERVGRRARMSIRAETLEMLRAGYPRIYGFGEPWRWDGRWTLMVVRVPEHRREIRDAMRTQFAWTGFGSLGGGLWISPHSGRAGELRANLNGDGARLVGFDARLTSVDDPSEIVAAAWDLDAVAETYARFLEDFADPVDGEPAQVFAAQTRMVHAWRKFPFVDPNLPDEVLPADWPRNRARELFLRRHAEWAGVAESYFLSRAG